MATLNKVFLLGNLTADPEVRYTPKGTAVTDLRLAVNRIRMEDGKKQEETLFTDVTVWGRQAENAGQYLSKGRPVLIEGRLQLDQWEDKTSGQKRSRLRVVADNVQFLSSGNSSSGNSNSAKFTNNSTSEASFSDGNSEEDDIPF